MHARPYKSVEKKDRWVDGRRRGVYDLVGRRNIGRGRILYFLL